MRVLRFYVSDVFLCIAISWPMLGLIVITLQLTVLHSFEKVHIYQSKRHFRILESTTAQLQELYSSVALLYFSPIRLSLEVKTFCNMQ
jgi:hypothetical protein